MNFRIKYTDKDGAVHDVECRNYYEVMNWIQSWVMDMAAFDGASVTFVVENIRGKEAAHVGATPTEAGPHRGLQERTAD